MTDHSHPSWLFTPGTYVSLDPGTLDMGALLACGHLVEHGGAMPEAAATFEQKVAAHRATCREAT